MAGLTSEWPAEHEMLATLIEVTVNRGLKKYKWVRVPRPKPVKVEQARSKAAVVDRVIAFAKRMGGGG